MQSFKFFHQEETPIIPTILQLVVTVIASKMIKGT